MAEANNAAAAAEGERKRFDRYADALGDRNVAFQLLFEKIRDLNKHSALRAAPLDVRASFESELKVLDAIVGRIHHRCLIGEYLMQKKEQEATRRLDQLNFSLRGLFWRLKYKRMVSNEEEFPMSRSLVAYSIGFGVLAAGIVIAFNV